MPVCPHCVYRDLNNIKQPRRLVRHQQQDGLYYCATCTYTIDYTKDEEIERVM